METAHRIPLARDEGLVVEELGDELLVYDLTRDEAHCLGTVAARVWNACDGSTTVDSLSAQLSVDHETVVEALSGLRACHLLDEGPAAATITRRGLTRRAVKIGAAAVAAPLIVSIAAPAAAMAVTESFCAKISVATGHGCGECHKYGCCCCEPKGAGGQNSYATKTGSSSSTKPCHADCHTNPACNVGVQANCNGNTANCQN
jgi:hypothetical protein